MASSLSTRCSPLLYICLSQGTPPSPVCCFLHLVAADLLKQLPPTSQRAPHTTFAKTRAVSTPEYAYLGTDC